MYKILDKNNETHFFQKLNNFGCIHYCDINDSRRNIIVYKNRMLYLSGIFIPKKEYRVQYVDINRFIDYNPTIHDCVDFFPTNHYSVNIKKNKNGNKEIYLKDEINNNIEYLHYYDCMLIMYQYYLMYQVDQKTRYKNIYEKFDKYLTERYWTKESEV